MDYTALHNAANNITSAAANLATAVSALAAEHDAEQQQIDDLAGQISLANESVSASVLSLNGMLQPQEAQSATSKPRVVPAPPSTTA